MNNYNQSSAGESIEFRVFYDNDLSQIYYDDFEAENTRLNFGRDSALFLVGDSSNPFYTKYQLDAMSKAEVFDLWINYEFGYSVAINDYLKSEYISDLLTVTIKRHYEYLISQYSWHDIKDNFAHDSYISHGYSQGDSVYIVSLESPIDRSMRKYIDHILWDCPLNIRADINGIDYYEDSFLTDCYSYDTDAIKEKIQALEISDYAKQWLCDNLPDYPEYLL